MSASEIDDIEDRLYVRILDTAAALEARGYQAEGRLVLDVVAPDGSDVGTDPAVGRWVLEAGPDGASCRPAPQLLWTSLEIS